MKGVYNGITDIKLKSKNFMYYTVCMVMYIFHFLKIVSKSHKKKLENIYSKSHIKRKPNLSKIHIEKSCGKKNKK